MNLSKAINKCRKLLSEARHSVINIPNLQEIIHYLELDDRKKLFYILCYTKDKILITQYLLDNTPEIDINQEMFNNNGIPLFIACFTNNPELMQVLIHNGANIYQKDNEGNTPLMFSFYKPSLMKILLDASTNPIEYINMQNNAGTTALMIACKFLNMSACKFLINNGANAAIIDNANHTAAGYVNLINHENKYKNRQAKILKLINV